MTFCDCTEIFGKCLDGEIYNDGKTNANGNCDEQIQTDMMSFSSDMLQPIKIDRKIEPINSPQIIMRTGTQQPEKHAQHQHSQSKKFSVFDICMKSSTCVTPLVEQV